MQDVYNDTKKIRIRWCSSDKTLSLNKQDIIETKRLLVKSIKGETISSDEPMDLTTETTIKKIDTLHEKTSDDDSLAIRPLTPIIKKRKISPDNSRKQPSKKRVRKISGEAARKYFSFI
jgi:hypothetical protein